MDVINSRMRLALTLLAAAFACLLWQRPAQAVPSFAAQTGQPCTACHIGAFGPQLTAYGRAFKIGGYTQTGGEGLASKIPLAMMVQTSFNNLQNQVYKGYFTDFGQNNNFAMDQASLFVAGRITDFAGALIQTTYSGIGKNFFLDNSDVRLTTPVDIGDTNLRIGLSFNNGPTVQDPFNGSSVWGPPYQGSSLAPHPAAQPLLVGAFQGNSLGVTAYAWYDNALYGEFGAYNTYDASVAKTLGQYTYPGPSMQPMPYLRLAYEWDWGGQSAYIGGIWLNAQIEPGGVPGFGVDKYNDFEIDGSYQFIGDGRNIFSFLGSYYYEDQHLGASYAQGLSANQNNTLQEFRATFTYFRDNTYGGSLGIQQIWGTTDTGLYAPVPIDGSRTGSPNTTAITAEADWVPFGKEESWGRPFANVKLGLQYTYYPVFNGAGNNYDGYGRNAVGNSTLYAFAWFAF